jgi:hypothetical protein
VVRNPTFGGFEGRFSEEGGTDVLTTWATRNQVPHRSDSEP